jgi:hypothetical protein
MHQRIAGVAILEADTAKRIACRYFDHALRTFDQQSKFEKDLVSKAVKSSAVLAAAGIGSSTASAEKGKDNSTRSGSSVDSAGVQGSESAEIVLLDEFIVVLRLVNDVLIAVTARQDQNDLLVSEYASTVVQTLNRVTLNTVMKKKLFDRLDQVFLILDESVEEGGIIFELDAHNIYSRLSMNEESATATPTNRPAGRTPVISASTAVREGIAAISRGDTDSLRSVWAGAAQSFTNFLGR